MIGHNIAVRKFTEDDDSGEADVPVGKAFEWTEFQLILSVPITVPISNALSPISIQKIFEDPTLRHSSNKRRLSPGPAIVMQIRQSLAP